MQNRSSFNPITSKVVTNLHFSTFSKQKHRRLSCTACPAGQFRSAATLTGCAICPKGSETQDSSNNFNSGSDSVKCQACSSGKYGAGGLDADGKAIGCIACPKGKVVINGQHCIPCAAGKFKSSAGSETCDECPAGKYESAAGQSKCSDCPKGRYKSLTNMEKLLRCTNCVAGKYNASTAQTNPNSCVACAAGKYSKVVGAITPNVCKVCPAGRGQDTATRSSCAMCASGFYSDATIPGCSVCPSGKFAAEAGMTECLLHSNCPPGKGRDASALYSGNGTANTDTVCKVCPLGSNNNSSDKSVCDANPSCPAGQGFFRSAIDKIGFCEPCQIGYFSSSDDSTPCVDNRWVSCPSHSEQAATFTINVETQQPRWGDVGGYLTFSGTGLQECNRSPRAIYSSIDGMITGIEVLDSGECLNLSTLNVGGIGSATFQLKRVPFSLALSNSGKGFTKQDVNVIFSGNSTPCSPSGIAYTDVHPTNDTDRSVISARVIDSSDCMNLPTAKVTGSIIDATFHVIRDDHLCRCGRGYHGTPQWDNSTNLGWINSASVCIKCTDGQYWERNGVISTCTNCPLGKFAAAPTVSQTWTAVFPLQCSNCDNDKYTDEEKSSECKTCPLGSYRTDLEGTFLKSSISNKGIGCVPCPAGKFANENADTDNNPCVACGPGSYTANGPVDGTTYPAHVPTSGATHCVTCPAGKYSPISTTQCISCDPGSQTEKKDASGNTVFTSGAAATMCSMCEAGKFSPVSTTACQACNSGSVTKKNGLHHPNKGATVCSACPESRWSPVSTVPCVVCPGGFELQKNGQHCGENCTGSNACIICTAGKATNDYKIVCTICGAGKYAATTNSTTNEDVQYGTGAKFCANCKAGWYRKHDQSITDNPSECQFCPPGNATTDINRVHTALPGAANCLACSSGKFSPTSTTACAACPTIADTGQYTASAASVTNDNLVSGTGATHCNNCKKGWFSNTLGSTDACIECPGGSVTTTRSGTFTNGTGAMGCVKCPAGSHSSRPYVNCVVCAAGKYAALQTSSINGFAADTTGAGTVCNLCKAGYFQDSNATSPYICKECPAGSKAGPAEENGNAKKLGATNCIACPIGQFNLKSVDNCPKCPPGQFTNETGTTDVSPPQSVSNTKICKLCPAGNRTNTGADSGATVCINCGPGKFSRRSNIAECKLCPPGQWTSLNTAAGTNGSQPATGTALPSLCLVCEKGSQTQDTAGTTLKDYTSAAHGALAGAINCLSCTPGKFSPGGISANGMSGIPCKNCPGISLSLAGAELCTICPPGKYRSAVVDGVATCIVCAPGNITNTLRGVDAQACIQCVAGQFSKRSDTCRRISGNDDCTTADLNGENALSCHKCAPGKYITSNGETECLKCPKGSEIQTSGQFNSGTGGTHCEKCAPGKFGSGEVNDNGNAIGCANCDVGHYVLKMSENAGAYNCLVCPHGKFVAVKGETQCEQCQIGKYQKLSGQTICNACDAGYYNPNIESSQESDCASCPFGRYSTTLGATALTDCIKCIAGKFSNRSGQNNPNTCITCPSGKKGTGDGDDACISCDSGRYLDLIAKFESQTNCISCPVGKFAPQVGMESCIFHRNCPKGEGRNTSAANHGNGTTTIDTICEVCRPGSFDTGLDDMSPCTSESQCPVGMGIFLDNNQSIGDCRECRTGYYSADLSSKPCTDNRWTICPSLTDQSGAFVISIDKTKDDTGWQNDSTGYLRFIKWNKKVGTRLNCNREPKAKYKSDDQGKIIEVTVLDSGDCLLLPSVQDIKPPLSLPDAKATFLIVREGFGVAVESGGAGYTNSDNNNSTNISWTKASEATMCVPVATSALNPDVGADDSSRNILSVTVSNSSDCMDLPTAIVTSEHAGSASNLAKVHSVRNNLACRCKRGFGGSIPWNRLDSSGWSDYKIHISKGGAGYLHGGNATITNCTNGNVTVRYGVDIQLSGLPLGFDVMDGTMVTTSIRKQVQSITKDSTGTVTVTSHGFSVGDQIYFDSVLGMSKLNTYGIWTIKTVTTNTFEIGDTTNMGSVFTSGFVNKIVAHGTVKGNRIAASTAITVTVDSLSPFPSEASSYITFSNLEATVSSANISLDTSPLTTDTITLKGLPSAKYYIGKAVTQGDLVFGDVLESTEGTEVRVRLPNDIIFNSSKKIMFDEIQIKGLTVNAGPVSSVQISSETPCNSTVPTVVMPAPSTGNNVAELKADFACTECPIGKYWERLENISRCISCPAGKAATYTQNEPTSARPIACTHCEAGKFAPLPGTPICLNCPSGSITNTGNSVGAEHCDACGAGKFILKRTNDEISQSNRANLSVVLSDDGDVSVTVVSGGSGYIAGAIKFTGGTCRVVPEAIFAVSNGAVSSVTMIHPGVCFSSPSALRATAVLPPYTAIPDTSCNTCSPGSYVSRNPQQSHRRVLEPVTVISARYCLHCPAGYFSPQSTTTCKFCGPGSHTANADGIFIAGTAATKCVRCEEGSASHVSTTQCSACGPGKYATQYNSISVENGGSGYSKLSTAHFLAKVEIFRYTVITLTNAANFPIDFLVTQTDGKSGYVVFSNANILKIASNQSTFVNDKNIILGDPSVLNQVITVLSVGNFSIQSEDDLAQNDVITVGDLTNVKVLAAPHKSGNNFIITTSAANFARGQLVTKTKDGIEVFSGIVVKPISGACVNVPTATLTPKITISGLPFYFYKKGTKVVQANGAAGIITDDSCEKVPCPSGTALGTIHLQVISNTAFSKGSDKTLSFSTLEVTLPAATPNQLILSQLPNAKYIANTIVTQGLAKGKIASDVSNGTSVVIDILKNGFKSHQPIVFDVLNNPQLKLSTLYFTGLTPRNYNKGQLIKQGNKWAGHIVGSVSDALVKITTLDKKFLPNFGVQHSGKILMPSFILQTSHLTISTEKSVLLGAVVAQGALSRGQLRYSVMNSKLLDIIVISGSFKRGSAFIGGETVEITKVEEHVVLRGISGTTCKNIKTKAVKQATTDAEGKVISCTSSVAASYISGKIESNLATNDITLNDSSIFETGSTRSAVGALTFTNLSPHDYAVGASVYQGTNFGQVLSAGTEIVLDITGEGLKSAATNGNYGLSGNISPDATKAIYLFKYSHITTTINEACPSGKAVVHQSVFVQKNSAGKTEAKGIFHGFTTQEKSEIIVEAFWGTFSTYSEAQRNNYSAKKFEIIGCNSELGQPLSVEVAYTILFSTSGSYEKADFASAYKHKHHNVVQIDNNTNQEVTYGTLLFDIKDESFGIVQLVSGTWKPSTTHRTKINNNVISVVSEGIVKRLTLTGFPTAKSSGKVHSRSTERTRATLNDQGNVRPSKFYIDGSLTINNESKRIKSVDTSSQYSIVTVENPGFLAAPSKDMTYTISGRYIPETFIKYATGFVGKIVSSATKAVVSLNSGKFVANRPTEIGNTKLGSVKIIIGLVNLQKFMYHKGQQILQNNLPDNFARGIVHCVCRQPIEIEIDVKDGTFLQNTETFFNGVSAIPASIKYKLQNLPGPARFSQLRATGITSFVESSNLKILKIKSTLNKVDASIHFDVLDKVYTNTGTEIGEVQKLLFSIDGNTTIALELVSNVSQDIQTSFTSSNPQELFNKRGLVTQENVFGQASGFPISIISALAQPFDIEVLNKSGSFYYSKRIQLENVMIPTDAITINDGSIVAASVISSGECSVLPTMVEPLEIEGGSPVLRLNKYDKAVDAPIENVPPHREEGSFFCKPCAKKTFSTESPENGCSACPAGSVATKTSLNTTPHIWVQSDGAGPVYCIACSAGQSSENSDTACLQCGAGKYAASAVSQRNEYETAQSGAILCNSCMPGWWSSSTNGVKCTKCAIGKYQPNFEGKEEADCIACTIGEEGKIEDVEGEWCKACLANYVNGTAGQATCTMCDNGKYAFLEDGAAKECKECPLGWLRNRSIFYDVYGSVHTIFEVPSSGNYVKDMTVSQTNGAIGKVILPVVAGTQIVAEVVTGTFQANVQTTFTLDGSSTMVTPEVWNAPRGAVVLYPPCRIKPEFWNQIECETLGGVWRPITETSASEATVRIRKNKTTNIEVSSAGKNAKFDTVEACASRPLQYSKVGISNSCMIYKSDGRPVGPLKAIRKVTCSNALSKIDCEKLGAGCTWTGCNDSRPEHSTEESCGGKYDIFSRIFFMVWANTKSCNDSSKTRSEDCTGSWDHDGNSATALVSRVWTSFSTTCTACPVGKFQNMSGRTACVDCDGGSYTPAPGIALGECSPCQAGKQATFDKSACSDCPDGQISLEGKPCFNCAVGKYSNESKTVCILCAAGKYQKDVGKTKCENCEPGKFQDEKGSPNCINCSTGKYSKVQGRTVCKTCVSAATFETHSRAELETAKVDGFSAFSPCSELTGNCMCPSGFRLRFGPLGEKCSLPAYSESKIICEENNGVWIETWATTRGGTTSNPQALIETDPEASGQQRRQDQFTAKISFEQMPDRVRITSSVLPLQNSDRMTAPLTLSRAASAVNNFYEGWKITVISETPGEADETFTIRAYNGSTRKIECNQCAKLNGNSSTETRYRLSQVMTGENTLAYLPIEKDNFYNGWFIHTFDGSGKEQEVAIISKYTESTKKIETIPALKLTQSGTLYILKRQYEVALKWGRCPPATLPASLSPRTTEDWIIEMSGLRGIMSGENTFQEGFAISSDDDYYLGWKIKVSIDGTEQISKITKYVGSTRKITTVPTLTGTTKGLAYQLGGDCSIPHGCARLKSAANSTFSAPQIGKVVTQTINGSVTARGTVKDINETGSLVVVRITSGIFVTGKIVVDGGSPIDATFLIGAADIRTTENEGTGRFLLTEGRLDKMDVEKDSVEFIGARAEFSVHVPIGGTNTRKTICRDIDVRYLISPTTGTLKCTAKNFAVGRLAQSLTLGMQMRCECGIAWFCSGIDQPVKCPAGNYCPSVKVKRSCSFATGVSNGTPSIQKCPARNLISSPVVPPVSNQGILVPEAGAERLKESLLCNEVFPDTVNTPSSTMHLTCDNDGVPILDPMSAKNDSDATSACGLTTNANFYTGFPAFSCPVGSARPHVCPNGNFCQDTKNIPSRSPAGSYAKAGAKRATKCDRGKFCREGMYREPTGADDKCPDGNFCAGNDIHPCERCEEEDSWAICNRAVSSCVERDKSACKSLCESAGGGRCIFQAVSDTSPSTCTPKCNEKTIQSCSTLTYDGHSCTLLPVELQNKLGQVERKTPICVYDKGDKTSDSLCFIAMDVECNNSNDPSADLPADCIRQCVEAGNGRQCAYRNCAVTDTTCKKASCVPICSLNRNFCSNITLNGGKTCILDEFANKCVPPFRSLTKEECSGIRTVDDSATLPRSGTSALSQANSIKVCVWDPKLENVASHEAQCRLAILSAPFGETCLDPTLKGKENNCINDNGIYSEY
eukprot:g2919.t1